MEGKTPFSEHHLSYAASAYYPSRFKKEAVLTVYGVGVWTTTSLSIGNGRDLQIMKKLRFPHSLGLLYSAFTQFAGFKLILGKKANGSRSLWQPKYAHLIKEKLILVQAEGPFKLNMYYFYYQDSLTMINNKIFANQ